MPTITFSLKDLQNLLGKKLTIEELEELVSYGKGELDNYDKETNEVSVDFGDTNLPYLWSVEGIARYFKGILGIEKGIPKIEIAKAGCKVIVDSSVNPVRPYIGAFVVKGKKVDDYLIKQLVQLQEKLCESFGRRRQKIAIGIYSYDKIKFPVHYKATSPESIRFIPLEYKKEMTQQEILEEHPKGKEYAWILKGQSKYPILIDSANQVLSFPPVINSNWTGKVTDEDKNLFIEATGTELEPLLLALNIMAYAFYDRGFELYSVEIVNEGKKMITPVISSEKIKLSSKQITSVTGLELKTSELKALLEKARYDVTNSSVSIPPYRGDILHPVDVIEDIAIMYGYNNFKDSPLTSYTTGETSDIVRFRNKIRDLMIGLGYQEVLSPVLSNKQILLDSMDCRDFGTIEIENFMSETFSAVRSWLIPILMDFLSKNKHVEYPQKAFEQGLVSVRKDEQVIDYERIAAVSANEKADYTEIRQVLDYILRILGVEYTVEETEHDSFLPGRVGRVLVNGVKVAYIGEMSPQVLSNHGLEVPVCAMELNLSELFRVINNDNKVNNQKV